MSSKAVPDSPADVPQSFKHWSNTEAFPVISNRDEQLSTATVPEEASNQPEIVSLFNCLRNALSGAVTSVLITQ